MVTVLPEALDASHLIFIDGMLSHTHRMFKFILFYSPCVHSNKRIPRETMRGLGIHFVVLHDAFTTGNVFIIDDALSGGVGNEEPFFQEKTEDDFKMLRLELHAFVLDAFDRVKGVEDIFRRGLVFEIGHDKVLEDSEMRLGFSEGSIGSETRRFPDFEEFEDGDERVGVHLGARIGCGPIDFCFRRKDLSVGVISPMVEYGFELIGQFLRFLSRRSG